MIREQDTDERDDQVDDDQEHDAPDDAAIEARARKNGWFPESEWDEARAKREGKTKPARFLTAAEYLDRVENEIPLLRERNRKLDSELTKVNGKLSEMGTQLKETRDLIVTQHEMTKRSNKKAFEDGIEHQKKLMRQAVKEGDTEAFDAAEKEKEALEGKLDALDAGGGGDRSGGEDDDSSQRTRENGQGDGKPPKKGDRSRFSPEMQAWLDDPKNSWFHSNYALNGVMIKYYGVIKAQNPDWNDTQRLEEAERMAREKLPEEFGQNPNRKGQGATTRGNSEDRNKKGKNSFDSIPQEDKQVYYRLKKQFEAVGKKLTPEEYAEDYFNQ